ncbi:hypothetical protein AAHA92_03134 [Salvia divinorum]|uniref:Uncharacterized protein n=1 Tax=Salvia divinorum TaxID=28513 RepID=A0ABD1IG40_SALDI
MSSLDELASGGLSLLESCLFGDHFNFVSAECVVSTISAVTVLREILRVNLYVDTTPVQKLRDACTKVDILRNETRTKKLCLYGKWIMSVLLIYLVMGFSIWKMLDILDGKNIVKAAIVNFARTAFTAAWSLVALFFEGKQNSRDGADQMSSLDELASGGLSLLEICLFGDHFNSVSAECAVSTISAVTVLWEIPRINIYRGHHSTTSCLKWSDFDSTRMINRVGHFTPFLVVKK